MNEMQKVSRTLVGKVVSNKMDKTVVVTVDRKIQDPIYGKYIRRSTKLHVHDIENQCSVGDKILIKEIAPISKKKNWLLVEILEKQK